MDRLKEAGIQPMLVTTVPVARPGHLLARLKTKVKEWIGKPSKLTSLTAFNNWMSDYGRRAGVPVFDAASFLGYGSEEGWLRADYDAGDGVHLNSRAYAELDREFARFLASWESGSQIS